MYGCPERSIIDDRGFRCEARSFPIIPIRDDDGHQAKQIAFHPSAMHGKIEVADQEPADQSQTAVTLSHPGR